MPHVVIRCFKADIPSAALECIRTQLTRLLQQQLGCEPAAVSIDVLPIDPAQWASTVYHPLIQPRLDALLQRPGYSFPPTS